MRTAVSSIVILAVAAVVCAGCSMPSSPPPSLTPWDGPSVAGSTSAAQLAPSTATAVTPSSGRAGTPLRIPSPAPPPDTGSATYADPVTVAKAWLQQWCQTDYQEPINAAVTRAAVFATPAATAADTAAGDTADSYRLARSQQVSARCDGIAAQVDPEAPASPTQVYVRVSANRTQLAAAVPFQTMPFSTMRRVVRGGDGRWLVDIAVDAG